MLVWNDSAYIAVASFRIRGEMIQEWLAMYEKPGTPVSVDPNAAVVAPLDWL